MQIVGNLRAGAITARLMVFLLLLGSLGGQALAEGPGSADRDEGGLQGAVTKASIAAFLAAVGWVAAYVMNGRRDDRTKRLQLTIENTSAQIREFYAPLVALTEQLNTMAAVKDEAVRGKSPEADHDISGAFYEMFFLPLHREIDDILKTKVHLLEGADIPDSFQAYFEHFASERAYWQLERAGKDVAGMQVASFPPSFYWDVRKGYQDVLTRYDANLKELRHPSGWDLFRLGSRARP